MLTTYFQCYLCNEDPEEIYILTIECGGLFHQIMMAVATVSLVIYLGFMVLE
jgi:hypothetical protein